MTPEQGMQPTITAAEANRKVEQYSASAAKDLFPADAKLVISYTEYEGDCSDPTDNGPLGRVTAARAYQVRGIDEAQHPKYFDALHKWFEKNNFGGLSDERLGKDRSLGGENRSDGFRLSMRSNNVGELYLNTSSPCVWPNGTPEPKESGE